MAEPTDNVRLRSVKTPLLRNRDYPLLWSGQTISAAGSQVSGFVLPLLVLQRSGSAAQAGFVGAFGGLPAIVLSLAAGALAHRWDRKRLMNLCDAGRTLNMLSIPIALALGHLGVPQLYLVSLVEGILYGLGTYALPFLADAVSYTVSTVSLLFICTEFQAERTPR